MRIFNRISDALTGSDRELEDENINEEDQNDYLERIGVTSSRPVNNEPVAQRTASASIDLERIRRQSEMNYMDYFQRNEYLVDSSVTYQRESVSWPRSGERTALPIPMRDPRSHSPYYESSVDTSKHLSERTKTTIIDSILRDCYEMVMRATDQYEGSDRHFFEAMSMLADTFLEEISRYVKMRHIVRPYSSLETFSRSLLVSVEMPGNPGVVRELRLDLSMEGMGRRRGRE